MKATSFVGIPVVSDHCQPSIKLTKKIEWFFLFQPLPIAKSTSVPDRPVKILCDLAWSEPVVLVKPGLARPAPPYGMGFFQAA